MAGRGASVGREHDAAVVVGTRRRTATVVNVCLEGERVQTEQVRRRVGHTPSVGCETGAGRRRRHAGPAPLAGPGAALTEVSPRATPTAGVDPGAGRAAGVDGTTDAVAARATLSHVTPAHQTRVAVVVVVVVEFVAAADVVIVIVRGAAQAAVVFVVVTILVHRALLSAHAAVRGAAVVAEAVGVFVVGLVLVLQVVDDLPLVVLALHVAAPGGQSRMKHIIRVV